MPNTALTFLVLPRLHPELIPDLTEDTPYSLPEGSLFLWPGLPHPPGSGVLIPDYPWSPAQAAACVADFERAGREGARGAPVGAFSVGSMVDAGDDLSPGERRALRELMGEAAGRPASSPVVPDTDDGARRQAAQRVLLLAWLQEKQVLELRELERRVRRGQSALAGLLGDGTVSEPEADGGGDEVPLPAWRSVLAAASTVLPGLSAPDREDETAVLAADRDMASTLAAFGPGRPAGAVRNLPTGFGAVRVPPGRALGRGWTVSGPERSVLFVYPLDWA